MQTIDLRSDTVTRPTPDMRRAMARAEVGDDVLDQDPTVARLEEATARLLGKEGAVFVPSGTMANQIAVGLSAGSGTQFLLHEGAHIYRYEGGAPAALWGTQLVPVPGDHGRYEIADIERELRPPDVHFAPLRAVSMEVTHNRAGGSVWPLDHLKTVADFARGHGFHVHIDGARLWNAAATGAGSLSDYAAVADPVSVCFSKGLGAPVGSALAGSREHMVRARALRKRLGGAMRQAGVVAAGALHALEHHRELLIQDHRRAAYLAEVLASLPGVRVLPQETNIVIADLTEHRLSSEPVVRALEEAGVRVLGFSDVRFRLVTHLEIDDEDTERAAAAFRTVLA